MRDRAKMAVALAMAIAGLPMVTGAPVSAAAAAVSKKASATSQRPKPTPEDAAPAPDVEDEGALASDAVVQMTEWIDSSRDNRDMPFMVIDKVDAKLFVFDAGGQFLGEAPVLLGEASGDESLEGIGDRELSDIKPEDRTTPAGRFISRLGPASGNRKVLWIDYPTSISMHPVVTSNKKERRPQRLASPTPDDNRITFGCINVAPAFYERIVKPNFHANPGVVYILPEFKTLAQVFPAFGSTLGRQVSASR